ncbi:uncharacterized protein A4U43_C01F11910 [Asparagus officinalis]|uniref:histidine kinase n=1 Tax=Asparagus officinalis TaxID=4686 RepID=A0A5P1FNW8_ASPOF|nr:histidine kinase 1 isoform X2 [Asparagus officinalis]ONK79928.1 uncharacterized protein A4U43_C01F11910 [Asparagus officinalis]
MTPIIMKHLKKFYTIFLPIVRSSSRNDQRRTANGGGDEEGFSYPTTRCLSSYYSIFVARLAIMIMLAILIGMLTILTWHFTRVYTTNSINSLAYGLRYELLQRPILRMWNILNSTVEITMAQVKLSEYVINRYDIPVTHKEQMELYQMMRDITWALFASRTALNSITISYRNGFVQAFHRDSRSGITFYIYSELLVSRNISKDQQGRVPLDQLPISKDGNFSSIWYREPLNPITGEKIGNRREIPPDDLINIAGLPEVKDGAASWRIAVNKFTDSPLLSAALPVRHPARGSIVAAVGVTTALKSVGQLMKELVGFHSGYMYLTTREGYVLATSTDAPLLRNTTTGLKLVMANDSDDPIIRSGAEWLQGAYGNQFPINHEIHDDNIILGKRRFYIDSFFLNLKRLPLVGVIIIPRKYIMGKVDDIAFTTLVILISLSMCILAIGCVCIFILTSGVSKAMNLRAELISHLDARRRAEASSNYKSQFLANMSHELRTPMAAVIGLLDILMYDNCLTNEQLSTITQIRKCSTALLRLLNNILDLSKVESGKLVLEEAEFDLGRELEGLVDMFSVQCINHKVEIILDLSDDLPHTVKGDSARIIQIFTNLISNSIKFTPEGHVILRGWCESFEDFTGLNRPDNQLMMQYPLIRKSGLAESDERKRRKDNRITLWFEVEDTGCGIDPSKWDSVFESFEQADPSTTRKHGGTGLGLCIVRNLINKMGGEIKVTRKDGPGTLMQLYLVLGMSEGGTEKHFQAEFSKYNVMVLLALKGSKGRFITSQWLKTNGIFTWEASEWNGLTQILQQIFKGDTTVEGGIEECSTSLKFNKVKAAPNQTKDQNMNCSSIVIVVDTSLLDQSTNIWSEQLIFLDRYREKAKFAWILSHDTSNSIKVELRRRGHYIMANKPLYKTKMIQILETVIKEESPENQRCGAQGMPEGLHELHEIEPLHFEDISSDESSDVENYHSRSSEVSFGERTREKSSVSHYSCRQIPYSVNESTHEVTVTDILPNPHLSLTGTVSKLPDALNCGINNTDPSKSYGHKVIKQDTMIVKAEKLQDFQQPLAIGSSKKINDTIIEVNQLQPGKENRAEELNQYHSSSTLLNKENSVKLAEEKHESTSGIRRSEQVKKECSLERLMKVVDRNNNLDDYDSTNREQNKVSSKVALNQGALDDLYILLAEDNLILQRVATAMLEKVGATVVVVGDGKQAVDVLKCMLCAEDGRRQFLFHQEGKTPATKQPQQDQPFDLVLMDCQMPKLDGYEATKAIRKLEEGTGSHIPIVAVTAHAMSSDEAKCLEVGMDAYLTKPIDCNLMVSTILGLTQRNG